MLSLNFLLKIATYQFLLSTYYDNMIANYHSVRLSFILDNVSG